MKASSKFDYIIVGGGLSGLHLSHSFLNDKYFNNYSFLMIDKKKYKKEDNFFSFWEVGNGKWDKILKQKWNKAYFYSDAGKVVMDFSEYNYKTLSSTKFEEYVKRKIKKKKNFKFINDTVLKIREEKNKLIVVGNKKNYQAKHVFDSRMLSGVYKEIKKYTFLKQHFLGWVIKTDEKKFNKKSFVFMDYRIRDKNYTAFTYVLPFKKNEALIEHTYFSKNECNREVYEEYIRKYLSKYYNATNYKIIKSEYGIIPMTSYPFYKESTKNITKIGTAGGWVKPSTGYSFKNCEKYSLKILEKIKEGKKFRIQPERKYYFLDKILLGVLSKYNHRGETVFYKMIKRNPTKRVLEFLNEESKLFDILKIIISVRSIYFIKVFIKSLYKKVL
ncbi:MAG: lycopene cyclase [Flavobacteriaceae bacterium]|nr:lycopene cyclase [Flavobacteriaceae bacterium]|tara:strand:+ start:1848 stop:3008 length:1161 start_codon:yes stop_codon:yes gene_type:complete